MKTDIQSDLPPTRRIERVTADPGPLPPRWKRVRHGSCLGYLQDNNPLLAVVLNERLTFLGSIAIAEAEDIGDIVRWLHRGGR